VRWNGIEKNCDGQFISPDTRDVLKYSRPGEGGQWGGLYPEHKKRSAHVRSHIRNRPKFVRFAFSQISAPMNFRSQCRPRSNYHWAYPQGPGTVSCTTRTTLVLHHCHRMSKFHSVLERNRKELRRAIHFASRPGRTKILDGRGGNGWGGRTPGHKTKVCPCEESYSAPTQQNSAFCFFHKFPPPVTFPHRAAGD